MVSWVKQRVPALVLDALLVLVLAFPGISGFLRWPMLAVYVVVSLVSLRMMASHWWVVTIVNMPAMRIAHGLEHAAIAVCRERDLPVTRGFTLGRDRFVVVLEADQRHQLSAVRDAAEAAIRRILAGERALAYHPGCGTSEVVSFLSLWLVYATSMLLAMAVGGTGPVFMSLGLIVLGIWLAWRRPLGLLAQRLFTVSTAFTWATVVDAQIADKVSGMLPSADETWVDIEVKVQPAASAGGFVSVGPFA